MFFCACKILKVNIGCRYNNRLSLLEIGGIIDDNSGIFFASFCPTCNQMGTLLLKEWLQHWLVPGSSDEGHNLPFYTDLKVSFVITKYYLLSRGLLSDC